MTNKNSTSVVRDQKTAMDEISRREDMKDQTWLLISDAIAHSLLEVLPPIYGPKGSFACGEPYSYNDQNETTYICCRRIDCKTGTAECRICSIRELKEEA